MSSIYKTILCSLILDLLVSILSVSSLLSLRYLTIGSIHGTPVDGDPILLAFMFCRDGTN